MIHQRVYQLAAGYEDCYDADFLRLDPVLRLAIGKSDEAGACQSRPSRINTGNVNVSEKLSITCSPVRLLPGIRLHGCGMPRIGGVV
jgi:hypothetical protein